MSKTTKFGKGIEVNYDFSEYVMGVEELTAIAKEFLKEVFDFRPRIPITVNNRLRTSLGSYVFERDMDGEETPLTIELSGELLRSGAREVIIDTLKHECVHYVLHMRGKPYEDGEPFFENTLKRLGISSTGNGYWVGETMIFLCIGCGEELRTTTKKIWNDHTSYTSGCCGASLVPTSLRVFDGTGSYSDYPNLALIKETEEEHYVK